MGIISAGLFLTGFLILFFNKWNIQRKAAAERRREEIQYQKTAEEMLEAKQAMAEAAAEETPLIEEQVEEVEESKEEKKEEAETKKPAKKPARKTKKKEE